MGRFKGPKRPTYLPPIATPFSLGRRRAMRTMAGAALSLPIAGALLQSRTYAQARDVPVRFLAIRSAHGTDRNRWIPRPDGGGEPAGTDMALSELNFDYQYSLAAPFQTSPLREKMTVIDGLDRWANEATGGSASGHFGAGAALTGARTNREQDGRPSFESLDQWLFGRLGPGEGPYLINATCSSGGNAGWKGMTFRGDGSGAAQERQPGDIFSTVFRGFTPEEPTGPPPVDRSGAQRGVYDHALEDLRRLRAELVGVERERLDEHIEAMERLRAEVMGGPGAGPAMCTTGEGDSPGNVDRFTPQEYAKVEEAAQLHARVIAQAFACGLSRVATLMHLDDFPSPYFEVPAIRAAHPGLSGEFHDPFTHRYWMNTDDPFVADVWSMAMRWQNELILMSLAELDAIIDPLDPSGEHTVLDNTIVYCVNEFGHGPHDRQGASVPAVLAGGGGGRFKTGRYLRIRDINTGNPRDVNNPVPTGRLLTSIAQAMGHDIGYYGDPGIGADPGGFPAFHGELTEIFR